MCGETVRGVRRRGFGEGTGGGGGRGAAFGALGLRRKLLDCFVGSAKGKYAVITPEALLCHVHLAVPVLRCYNLRVCAMHV